MKHLTSISCILEPAIWSRDTGQRIPCFDSCQLIITWMSNTREVRSKPRLHVSLSTSYLEYGRDVVRLGRRRRRAYARTSNTTSRDNHEKINLWISFCFPHMGCLWGSAWRPFGPPELRYYKWRSNKTYTKEHKLRERLDKELNDWIILKNKTLVSKSSWEIRLRTNRFFFLIRNTMPSISG